MLSVGQAPLLLLHTVRSTMICSHECHADREEAASGSCRFPASRTTDRADGADLCESWTSDVSFSDPPNLRVVLIGPFTHISARLNDGLCWLMRVVSTKPCLIALADSGNPWTVVIEELLEEANNIIRPTALSFLRIFTTGLTRTSRGPVGANAQRQHEYCAVAPTSALVSAPFSANNLTSVPFC